MTDEKQPKDKQARREKTAKASGQTEKGSAKGVATQEQGAPARLFERYRKDIVPALAKKFQYKSAMQVPRLEKISINMGIGQATQDPKLLDAAVRELEAITGQKAAVTRAKKAISNFKLREGLAIGCRVTLRRAKMYEFLDRFISVALPRVRDFRGLPDKSFDGHGNYTLGVKEQIIFPEIDVDKVTRISGMDITFVTTAKNDVESYELLKELGMPFVKRQEVVSPSANA
ncbi:MAG: 50S ribosomal protein L5 [Ignavibacteriales bacterium]|nr:50S ribosomal protein L5 [Ignavibacteriales bacterium]